MRLTIPPDLAAAAEHDSERRDWLAGLPRTVDAIAGEWELKLGEPYLPGGVCAWVAPAGGPAGEALVLKVGWRHVEAEHEADALRLWDGDGAVRCLASRAHGQTAVLLLERCEPGVQVGRLLPEREQDAVLARLARRLWQSVPTDGHPFRPLQELCDRWAESSERRLKLDASDFDRGLVNAGIELFRELPRTAERNVLLCTDLHAGNVLSARREPWLVIDPKPFIGDPAFDAVQHMLNCDQRLASAPEALAERMAALLDVDPLRVRLWLFARCAQESIDDPSMRQPARRVAP